LRSRSHKSVGRTYATNTTLDSTLYAAAAHGGGNVTAAVEEKEPKAGAQTAGNAHGATHDHEDEHDKISPEEADHVHKTPDELQMPREVWGGGLNVAVSIIVRKSREGFLVCENT
jgi:hypothetical protein